jgi:propanol-preferring alcohol dehydrogenase
VRSLRVESPRPAADGPLVLVEGAGVEAGPGELSLRVSACAVCRTDLQIAEGDLAARRLPIVPGHQVVGVVERVGDGVGGWTIGDRVGVTWLASACGRCRFCTSDRENLCPDARFTGWDRDGGFAERMAVRADFAVRLPAGFDDVEAAPLLCGGVIGYRALRIAGLGPGSAGLRLGLYGFGSSATQCIQVARAWGAEIHVASRSSADLERAERLGAASVGGYDEPPPHPLDAAISFAPVGSVAIAALRALDRGGTVVINAIHLDRVPEYPYELLWWERSVRSVANVTRADATAFLDVAASIGLRTETETFDLEGGNEALTRLAAGTLHGTAVLRP